MGSRAEMLAVAEEATHAGDFNLAAEIYGSQLSELPHPVRDLCVMRADALSRAGRVVDALDSYRTAAAVAALRPDELRVLVECVARGVRARDGEARGSGRHGPLACGACARLLLEPVTLRCGHTFCRRCCVGARECVRCGQPVSRADALRVNVVLSGLLERGFTRGSGARRLWHEAEELRERADTHAALDKYAAALELDPEDCELIGQRAHLYLQTHNYSLAIKDGEAMCHLQRLLPEAHYVKALALNGLGRADEALQEFLFCVALKPDWTAAKLEAQKILSDMFSSVFESESLPPFLSPQGDVTASARLKSPILLGLSSQDHGMCPNKEPLRHSASESDTQPTLSPGLQCAISNKRKSPDGAPTCSRPTKLLKQDFEPASSPDEACASHTVDVSPVSVARLLDSSDVECSLCMRLFYEPVATPCGHTFCLKCLERCLDHNPNCPLCKENLSEYLASRGYNKTVVMEEVLQRYLPDELAERKKIHEEELKELSNLKQEVPIFVCTMAFPTIPCPLHVFEPRYRLMIRRSMETGTKQFGMCIADQLKGFADHGCMLEVRDVKFFPDGRSVVDTIGVSRFRVLSHGQRDGYNTANIEYLEDRKVDGEELVELVKLYDAVYERAASWFSSLKDNMRNQILSHFGDLPGKDPDPQSSPDGPAWCWWLLAVLPLENRAQLSILAMTALKERLVAIRRVLLYVTRRKPR